MNEDEYQRSPARPGDDDGAFLQQRHGTQSRDLAGI